MADDRTPFETRLADVFERYADLAPLEIDPWVVTQAAVAAPGPGWRSRLGWTTAGVDGRGWTRLVLPLALVGLLIAALGAALWVGSQQDRNPLVDRGPNLPAAFVVEEVEPGVTRIVNDGVRDLSWDWASDGVGGIAAAEDGTIWVRRPASAQPSGLHRLGASEVYQPVAADIPWPPGDLVVHEDGTVDMQPRPEQTTWYAGRGQLTRWGDDGPHTYGAADGVPDFFTLMPIVAFDLLEAPDGAAWLNVFTDIGCDGIARFDGSRWTHYLKGTGICIVEFDIAADGSVWALGSDHTDGGYRPIQLYVIRHDPSRADDANARDEVPSLAPPEVDVQRPPVSGLTYTGRTAQERPAAAGSIVDPALGPVSIETAAGTVRWTRYGTTHPLHLWELRGGGYVLSPLTNSDETWYSLDGRSWVDWSGQPSFYADFTVKWLEGDWAMSTEAFEEPGDGPDHLWHYEAGVFSEVELPAAVRRVNPPIVSKDNELIIGDGEELTHDWIILVDGQGVVHQYASPWTIPEWVVGGDGVSHDVAIAANPAGGFVAIPVDHASEGQGPAPADRQLFESSGVWTTSDGLTWTLDGDPPFPAAGVDRLESNGRTIRADTDAGDWESDAGIGWTRAEPRVLPTGGAWQQGGYQPFDFRSSADFGAGRLATYGIIDPDTAAAYWLSPDGEASWSAIPGPPWVSENDYRGILASYVVTPDFLFAEDGGEWWIGTLED